ncbi:hypothetical protein PRIC1_001315 [Phytophthora ramorum]|uniref:PX domain-containing protein n=1 Tax=Phytophthora ramorum TaxID=164328 RepID=H3GQ15_PHYRM|nr:hypothetical protein KRP23_7968 [Phytophthora ramorum]KAH7508539.1 hypothetical protein KRP22_53 [Phytophthora ramorum]
MTGVATSSNDREQHKELLSVARATPTPTSASLPVLNAASLTPASMAVQASTSMDFLASIEQMRIADTHKSVRDGATLYEVQTYTLFQPTSNIPTVRNSGVQTPTRPAQTSVSQCSTTTPTDASASNQDAPERAPNLCVRRRFADFARLRHEALAASCVNAHFLCQYCRQFQTYARFHAGQPFWFLRVVTTTKQRKKILARFLADLAAFAQSRAQRDRHCRLRQTLPKLLEQFLTD